MQIYIIKAGRAGSSGYKGEPAFIKSLLKSPQLLQRFNKEPGVTGWLM
jgi:hypothetical protein